MAVRTATNRAQRAELRSPAKQRMAASNLDKRSNGTKRQAEKRAERMPNLGGICA